MLSTGCLPLHQQSFRAAAAGGREAKNQVTLGVQRGARSAGPASLRGASRLAWSLLEMGEWRGEEGTYRGRG